MPEPRYVLAAALLVLLTLAPPTGWPLGQVSAHAQTTRERGSAANAARSTSLLIAPGIYALVQR